MATCDKMMEIKIRGLSNPRSYTKYGNNSCDLYKPRRTVYGKCIMHIVTIPLIDKQMLSVNDHIPSCKVVLHCVQYNLDLVVQLCPTGLSQSRLKLL